MPALLIIRMLASYFVAQRGLHQLVGGSTGSRCSLLHFDWKEKINRERKPRFYLAKVLPSNILLSSDGA